MNFFGIFLIFSLVLVARCEFYSSIDKLRTLCDIEGEILRDFRDVIAKVDSIKIYLDKKLTPWIAEHDDAKTDTQTYVTNSLNSYLLLKRNVYDVKIVTGKLGKFIQDLQETIKKVEAKSSVEEREVSGAVGGLIRAQKAYQLKNDGLVEGVIDGLVSRKPLSPHDIFILGKSASLSSENNFFVADYMKIAKEKVDKGEDYLNEVNVTEIENYLAKLPKEIADPYDETYDLTATRGRMKEIYLVQKACRGNLTRTPKETKNLRCRMVSFTPFSLIGPFKLEEASIEPYVVIYHEVLSDQEVENLIELARKDQSRAFVGTDKRVVDHDRVAQLMWMYSNWYPKEAALLDARFEDMTGLSMETSEALQIQNYGVGGHYYAHYDALEAGKNMDESKDHRIATLMLYLKNVVKGGATVFPYLKIRVEPQKGSAVFWYNLKNSGHHEPYSLHSGCPLMIGNKWVANKWIHNTGQWFRRQCKPQKFVKKDDELEMLKNFKE